MKRRGSRAPAAPASVSSSLTPARRGGYRARLMDSPLGRTLDATKALANPARLRILAALERGECCVCQLTAVLELAPSTVSAHLSELKRAGFLLDRKDGKVVGRISPRTAPDDKEVITMIEAALAK